MGIPEGKTGFRWRRRYHQSIGVDITSAEALRKALKGAAPFRQTLTTLTDSGDFEEYQQKDVGGGGIRTGESCHQLAVHTQFSAW